MKSVWKGTVTVAILASVIPSFIQAATTYTVSPLVIDEEMTGRDIIKKDITITNTSPHKITVFPTVNEITFGKEAIADFVAPSMSDGRISITSWVEIKRNATEVGIGESITLPLTVHTAPEVEPGTYHAMVGFGTGRNVDEATEQVKNGKAPRIILTITIKDTKQTKLSLTGFVIDRFITAANNEGAHFTVNNSGDTPVTPRGEVVVCDTGGTEVAAFPVNSEGVTIAPGEVHTFDMNVPTEGLLGKYKGFLSVEYDDAKRATIHDTVFFYVVPLPKIIALFFFVLILSLALALYLHRRHSGEEDEIDYVPFHIKDTESKAQHHDIDLKQN